jgi:hypothetical protein
VRSLKTPKPATARHGEPVSKVERPGSKLDPTNTPKPDQLQAADTAGESDFDYFVARTDVDSRVRLPFADEVAPDLIEQGGRRAFIHVFIIRNSDGSPGTRARAIFYSDGGTA